MRDDAITPMTAVAMRLRTCRRNSVNRRRNQSIKTDSTVFVRYQLQFVKGGDCRDHPDHAERPLMRNEPPSSTASVPIIRRLPVRCLIDVFD